MLKFALLGFLNYKPMTGYDLKQAMEKSTANFWQAKQSQIYTTLKDMEKKELVVSYSEIQEGRPDKRVYSITDAGKNDLEKWLLEPVTAVERHKNTLLLKLFFSSGVDREFLLSQLRQLMVLYQREVERFSTETRSIIEETARNNPELRLDSILWDATRRLGEMHKEMYVAWLEETIAMIEKHF